MDLPIDPRNPTAGFDWIKTLDGALKGDHPALRKGNLSYELHVLEFTEMAPSRIAVIGVTGSESVNGLYEYVVEFVTPFPPEVFQPAVFGRESRLKMRTPGHDVRLITGLVARLEVCGVADRGLGKGLFLYRATIVPPIWLWTQRRRNRVFQNQSIISVIKSMLDADKLHHKLRLKEDDYPKLPLFYQRDETDFEFFQRLCAQVGIFYFFDHAVEDSQAGGALSMAGTIAGGVGTVASHLGKSLGSVASAGSEVSEALHAVTVLVLSDDNDGTTPLQDFAAVNDLANQGLQAGLGAATKALGIGSSPLGKMVSGAVGTDECDLLSMDDGYATSPGEERIYSFSANSNIRPKSVWSLERNLFSQKTWAHRERGDSISEPKLKLDLHFSIGRKGLGIDGGATVKLGIDTPFISSDLLEQELIDRNAGWLQYPSVNAPQKSGDGDSQEGHEHLKRPLEQLRRDSMTATAVTDCRRVAAGYRFKLDGHPTVALNTEYTVMQMLVVGVDPDMVGPDDPRVATPFRATLTCVPSDDITPRPDLPPKRTLGMELGTVVRWNESMDMVVDTHGEVLVRLGWDVEKSGSWFQAGQEKPFPTSSKQEDRDRVLRIPFVQPWAGAGYGLQAIPREGMQVVIGYLEDQGDRPVILGCLHSDVSPSPWTGNDIQKVGFLTQSRWPQATLAQRLPAGSKTTGYSEISIDDRAGDELILFRAEKDLNVNVLNDLNETVGGNVKRSHTHEVNVETLGNFTGDYKKDVEIDITQDLDLEVEGDLTIAVTGNKTETIEGHVSTNITGRLDVAQDGVYSAAFGDDVIERHSGHRTIIVGTATDKRSSVLHVEGAMRNYASGILELVADEGISLRCGDSVITMTDKTITIQSPTVSVLGKTLETTSTDKVTIAGKAITVGGSDSVAITGNKTTVMGQSAGVTLDSAATVVGGSIKLGSGSGDSAKADDKKPPKKTTLKLADQDGKPLADQRVILRKGGEGGEERMVVLDKDGSIVIEGDDSFDVLFPDYPDASE